MNPIFWKSNDKFVENTAFAFTHISVRQKSIIDIFQTSPHITSPPLHPVCRLGCGHWKAGKIPHSILFTTYPDNAGLWFQLSWSAVEWITGILNILLAVGRCAGQNRQWEGLALKASFACFLFPLCRLKICCLPFHQSRMNNTKRNKTGSFVEMWMDPETVIQSEISQKEKNQYHILVPIGGIYRYRRTYFQGRNRDTDVENKRGHRGDRGWVKRMKLT